MTKSGTRLTFAEARVALLAGQKQFQSKPVPGWSRASNPLPTVRGIVIGTRLYALCCPFCGAAWHQHGAGKEDVVGSTAYVGSHCLADSGDYRVQIIEVHP